jgi:hypothetical protein
VRIDGASIDDRESDDSMIQPDEEISQQKKWKSGNEWSISFLSNFLPCLIDFNLNHPH